MLSVQIQTAPFLSEETKLKQQLLTRNCGAIVSFTGFVRGYDTQEILDHLYLEHYPQVTESEIHRILQLAQKKWSIQACHVIHRIGHLKIGEEIVLVLTAATHRKAAFEANEFIMDYLKSEAPFWKKEFFKNGQSHWVKAKQSDLQQKERWLAHE